MSSHVAASLINECKMTMKAMRNRVNSAKTKTNNLQSCCSSLKNSSQLASLIANPTFLATAARYAANKINVLRQYKVFLITLRSIIPINPSARSPLFQKYS